MSQSVRQPKLFLPLNSPSLDEKRHPKSHYAHTISRYPQLRSSAIKGHDDNPMKHSQSLMNLMRLLLCIGGHKLTAPIFSSGQGAASASASASTSASASAPFVATAFATSGYFRPFRRSSSSIGIHWKETNIRLPTERFLSSSSSSSKRKSSRRQKKSSPTNMPRGVKKENLPSKVCVVCHRPFTWRKKWERVWDEVTTCSKSCNAKRRAMNQEANRRAKDDDQSPPTALSMAQDNDDNCGDMVSAYSHDNDEITNQLNDKFSQTSTVTKKGKKGRKAR